MLFIWLTSTPSTSRSEEVVPPAAPDDLDDVPARAAEDRLELLDDLAVAAHRTVEPLQVAVDDEDQVVELLARRDRQSGHRLGLVHLAVADERPHLRLARVGHLARHEVAVEAGLGHGVERAEAHRHRRKLPERRHAPRVRIRGQSPAVDLTPEAVEMLLVQPPFEERSGVHARRRVALEEHLVACAAVALAAEEVVEADVVQRGGRRERREVPTEPVEPVVGPVDHRHRVPADVRADAALEHFVTREPRLLLRRNRVDVVGRDHRGHPDALFTRPLHEAREQVARPLARPMSMTESSESSHSPVSCGSMSGRECTKPSMNTTRQVRRRRRLRRAPMGNAPIVTQTVRTRHRAESSADRATHHLDHPGASPAAARPRRPVRGVAANVTHPPTAVDHRAGGRGAGRRVRHRARR